MKKWGRLYVLAGITLLFSCNHSQNTEEEIKAKVLHTTYSDKNCEHADSVRNGFIPMEETSFFDTLCTQLDLDLISVELTNGLLANKINQDIQNTVLDIYSVGDEKYSSIKEMMGSVKNFGFEVTVTCSEITNEKSVLVISVNNSSYYYGAAHPNSYSIYRNYDLKNGVILKLDDLFIPNYESKLKAIVKKHFLDDNGDDRWFFNFDEDISFEISSDFAITKDGLLFPYDAYEIGPYAEGAPSTLIPYSELQPLMEEHSVLKRFIEGKK